jgi:hypothetical protein
MKQDINLYQFRDAFRDYGRGDQFTYQGLGVLFESLEQYGEGSFGIEVCLDVIALCCDFSEESWEDIASYYSIDLSDCEDDDEKHDIVLDYLNDNTMVCGETPHSIVYQSF